VVDYHRFWFTRGSTSHSVKADWVILIPLNDRTIRVAGALEESG